MLPFFAALASVSTIPNVSPSQIEAIIPDPIPSQTTLPIPPPLLSQAKTGQAKTGQAELQQTEFRTPQIIRPLPGALDDIPVFNSNNPEIVRHSGILLSTFPAEKMKTPEAHLDYAFKGRFDIFSHHIAKSDFPEYTPTLFLGILIKNASSKRKNVVDVLQAASYLGTPDAPYINLPAILPNDVGRVYSGPGGRVSDVVLRGIRQAGWSPQIELDPGESIMLMNVPMPLPTQKSKGQAFRPRIIQSNVGKGKKPLKKSPSSNARSTLVRMKSKHKVYVASMAMFAPLGPNGKEKIPTLQDWQSLLTNGTLIEPRDRPPSELNSKAEKFFYGRVSGVSRGSVWSTQITDKPKKGKHLTIPEAGQSISFGISTLQRGTFGTEQIQSAPMEVRYPDTAYLAHGNYGVHYQFTLPLKNPSKASKTISISLQTPVKNDDAHLGLKFYRNPPDTIFFRGTVRLRYRDDRGTPLVKYFHLVHRRGDVSSPLATVTLEPKGSRLISLDFVYPPDATPPQVLTVKTSEVSENE